MRMNLARFFFINLIDRMLGSLIVVSDDQWAGLLRPKIWEKYKKRFLIWSLVSDIESRETEEFCLSVEGAFSAILFFFLPASVVVSISSHLGVVQPHVLSKTIGLRLLYWLPHLVS